MRISAYIRILSDEATIRRIKAEANISDAAVVQLKAKKGSGDERWWNWETSKVDIDVDNVDAGINALLSNHQSMFRVAQKYKGPETEIYLEIVSRYGKGEEPRGLYLSPPTIALLGELGGALDHDVETSAV
jgi:hypothetical protein